MTSEQLIYDESGFILGSVQNGTKMATPTITIGNGTLAKNGTMPGDGVPVPFGVAYSLDRDSDAGVV
jgi:hypothetical protein